MSNDNLVSTTEAAAELGFSTSWVRRLVAAGRLPALQGGPGQPIHIRGTDLEAARVRLLASRPTPGLPAAGRLREPAWSTVVDTIDRWLVMPLRPYGATDAVDALRLRASQRERRRFATAVVSLAQHVSRAERDLTLRLRLAFAEALIDPQRMPGVAGELIRRRERRRPGTIAGIAVYLAYLCEQA